MKSIPCFVITILLSMTILQAEEPLTIVAFGDSTTAPRGELTVFASILQQKLSREGRPVRVINAGIGGNTTQDGRSRFKVDVLAHNPDFVIIQFGINDAAVDVWRDPPATEPRIDRESFTANLRYFIMTLVAHDVRVLLMTPNPMSWTDQLRQLYGKPPYNTEDPDGFNVLLKTYAEHVREVAKEGAVPIVDVYRLFERTGTSSGQSDASVLLLDGMHPNEEGHRLIADAILTELKRLNLPE